MELLAPAGNMNCLKAAIGHGADAVYFAGKSFGARSFAANFSEEELREAISYCHLRGVKAYLTVNTMTLDREFEELDAYLALFADAGADAVIVQDLGVLRRIRQICPELPIHASTQMTVHNLAGVQELEKLGVERVVLARELTEKEIGWIAQNCKAELEVFVHGAMCMSYSGQCLMSSVLGGRSGNRGKCAQPCRLAYQANQGDEKFYLSLKDMSLISHLQTLKEMGIASLKIEGRMKGEDYVSAVVETYRRCLDESRRPRKEEEDRLNRVFYRGGLTDGYFADNKGVEMFAFEKPDNPYAIHDDKKAEPSTEKTIPVACSVTLCEGKHPVITLTGLGHTVTCRGDEVLSRAQKNPAAVEDVKKQVSKTGGTAFRVTPITVELSGNPFVPVKVLNQLRRDAIKALEDAVLAVSKKTIQKREPGLLKTQKAEMKLTASVRTLEQFEAIREYPFAFIDVPLSVAWENPKAFYPDIHRVVIAPPVIVTDAMWQTVVSRLNELNRQGFTYLRAEHLSWLSEKENWTLLGGHRMNIANTMSVCQLKELGMHSVCLSAELNLAQIRDVAKPVMTELIIYGHLPLMITENCVLKNMNACPCDGAGQIQDRKGISFPVIKDDAVCRSVILNSVPLYLADKLEDIERCNIAFGRLAFTIESPKKCREVCQKYLNRDSAEGAYTRLHFHKGVL